MGTLIYALRTNHALTLFARQDYMQDVPTGKPIKSPEEYQAILKDYYYAM